MNYINLIQKNIKKKVAMIGFTRAILIASMVVSVVVGDSRLLVQTDAGLVQGVALVFPNQSQPAALGWLGIPYAESTAGPMRWTDPLPRRPWSGTFDASQFGPGCPQDCVLPPRTCPTSQSEDCLSLNVYAPS